jgi:NAD(P)-dependent dehydrogenase (short-subunit alcohol dehydrogenase family)
VLPGRLQDKVAVITGGNSGIGLATARLFRSEGARIAVIGRDPETVRRTVAPAGEDCFGFAGDVASTQSLNEFYSQVAARFGRIEELARAVLFFASDDSTYITGAELVVDGGMTQV